MSTSTKTRNATYRAVVGGRSLDIAFEDGVLRIDGEPVQYGYTPAVDGYVSLIVEGRSLPAVLERLDDTRTRVTMDGHLIDVVVKDERALLMERFGLADAAKDGLVEVRAPMPGLVLSINVVPGQTVHAGDSLAVLEAMKMENDLRAQAGGVVKHVHVVAGDAVGKNDLLIDFEAQDAA